MRQFANFFATGASISATDCSGVPKCRNTLPSQISVMNGMQRIIGARETGPLGMRRAEERCRQGRTTRHDTDT